VAWSIIVVPLVMIGLYWVLKWTTRKTPEIWRHVGPWMKVAAAALTIVVCASFLMLVSEQLEVSASADQLVETGCRGIRQYSRVVERRDIAGIAHQIAQSGGKSPQPIDVIVVAVKAQEPLRIQLSETHRLNFDALARVVPREALQSWATAIVARQKTPPPEIACLVGDAPAATVPCK